jgi:hypothetical protein
MRLALTFGTEAVELGRPELLSGSPLRRVYRQRGRVKDSPMWAELTYEALSNIPFLRFWLRWGDSDPRVPAVKHTIDRVELQALGVKPVIRHSEAKIVETTSFPGGWRFLLDAGGNIADGQGQLLAGVLLFPHVPSPHAEQDVIDQSTVEAEQILPVLVSCSQMTWAESKAFGPFGHVPLISEADAEAFAEREFHRHVPADPWQAPTLGCGTRPGQTGAQTDFGAVQGFQAMASPLALYPIQRSVYQEACRPSHYREVDCSPVTQSNHPELWIWDGRPHRRAIAWVDMLGKTENLADWDTRRSSRGENWWSHDRQHWSINWLCAYAQITGDEAAMDLVQNQVELWLGSHPVHSPSDSLNGPDASRGVGRGMFSGAWLYLLTGREDLRQRLVDRVAISVEPHWRVISRVGPVQPIALNEGSGAAGALLVEHWRPWEEAIAATGLEATYRVTGDPLAHEIAVAVAKTVTLFGWQLRLVDQYQIGTALAWQDGKPLTHDEGLDPAKARWADGTDYRSWARPAVEIALAHARAVNDQVLLLKADAILKSLHDAPPQWRTGVEVT